MATSQARPARKMRADAAMPRPDCYVEGVPMTSVAEPSNAPPAVRLTGITKRFPGVVANAEINITVQRGTVHALAGENGAGKSTLMKSLYGMHQPDEGTIEVDGKPVVFHTPADAIAAG